MAQKQAPLLSRSLVSTSLLRIALFLYRKLEKRFIRWFVRSISSSSISGVLVLLDNPFDIILGQQYTKNTRVGESFTHNGSKVLRNLINQRLQACHININTRYLFFCLGGDNANN